MYLGYNYLCDYNPTTANGRRCKVRLADVQSLVRAGIGSAVSDALQEQLAPLHTALRIVRLDTFSEGIVRQVGTR